MTQDLSSQNQRDHRRTEILSNPDTLFLSRVDVVAGGPGYIRPFSNRRGNSRLAREIGSGTWTEKWRSKLDPFFPYSFVLQSENRIVLQGDGRFQLLNRHGETIRLANNGDSGIELDPIRSLGYMVDPFGRLESVNLDDGQSKFILPIKGTNDYHRVFVSRVENRVIVVSSKRPTNPHGHVRAAISSVEVFGLADSMQIQDGLLLSAARIALHSIEAEKVLAAENDGVLVVARADEILRMDLDLNMIDEFIASFEPLAMSLDETGRIYIVVKTEDDVGRPYRALWVLTPDGKRIIEVEIDQDASIPVRPPIIGFDHEIYLLLGDTVLVIGQDGNVIGKFDASFNIAGAVITASNHLLVTAGRLLLSFSAVDEKEVLFVLPDGRWMTPPIIDNKGRILAASEGNLYCLEIQK